MSRSQKVSAVVLVILTAAAVSVATAAEVGLTSVLYPDNKVADLSFSPTYRAAKAELHGQVTTKDGQPQITLTYKNIEPAILFGGDITSYVVWAVTPAGVAENLGGIANLEKSGTETFSTPKKDFALMITAEFIATVRIPGDLVVYTSGPAELKGAKLTPFTFNAFKDKSAWIKHTQDSIVGLTYKDKAPLALMQAKKSVELADRVSASKYDADSVQKAKASLQTANDRLSKDWNDPKGLEAATATLEYSTRALTKWGTQKEIEKTEMAASTAAAEKTALAEKATTAEQRLKQKETELSMLQKQLDELKVENDRLRSENFTLTQQTKLVQEERDAVTHEVMGGISMLATSSETDRGYIITLSGTAFPSGQSTLTTDAKYILAKLSGLLMAMPEGSLDIEGHTDSTETPDMELSSARAKGVETFLREMGVPAARMRASGFGQVKPIAPNDTPEGRAKNRRVDLVIMNPEERAGG
jgi:outer membrane protein OmpA-like peptidoglycan-associated protein